MDSNQELRLMSILTSRNYHYMYVKKALNFDLLLCEIMMEFLKSQKYIATGKI